MKTRLTGRPSIYTQELALSICERVEDGEPLTKICKEDGMPRIGTLWRWYEGEVPDALPFRELLDRARAKRARTYMEELTEIADDGTNDTMIVKKMGREYEQFNNEYFQRSRLRIETRRYLLERQLGQVDLKSAEANTNHTLVFVDRPMSETREEWLARHQK